MPGSNDRAESVELSPLAHRLHDQGRIELVDVQPGQIGPNVKVFAPARHLGFRRPRYELGRRTVAARWERVQLWGSSLLGSLDIAYID